MQGKYLSGIAEEGDDGAQQAEVDQNEAAL